jgi:hypothetical protein
MSMTLPIEKTLKRDMPFCDISQKNIFQKISIDNQILP